MRLPTTEEIAQAEAVLTAADEPGRQTIMALQRVILDDPILSHHVDRLMDFCSEMNKPSPALARAIAVSGMRRGLFFGLVIGEMRAIPKTRGAA